MKYIREFRDGALARHLADRIAAEVRPDHLYRFMEFCGGHTHAIRRYGVLELLPPNVRMIHGPGCPVCVLPIGRVDLAIELALQHDVILCTYGDTMRVPASGGLSLTKAKARGGDIRMIYAASDALRLAQEHPERQVVLLAIGFETTTPPTALVIREAARAGLRNFSVLCNHVLTPPAIRAILDGAEGRAEVENEFTRAVTPGGNRNAQAVMDEVFELRPSFEWRGLGVLPRSALQIREEYRAYDAEHRFLLGYQSVPDHKACECGAILRGVKAPRDCKIFGTVCTPENPVGSCMVSSEGACAAHYTYDRFRDTPVTGVGEAASA